MSRVALEYLCKSCDHGTNYRLTIKHSPDSEEILFAANEGYKLLDILAILNGDYPEIWKRDTEYYFYLDMDSAYHQITDTFWLRDKDILIITTEEELPAKPKINVNAVFASFKSDVVLKPHQIEGVERMTQMERDYRGGILGDEMGLGKTIQMIALVMQQQSLYSVHASTLIVAPSIDICNQWAEEIRAKTYYGSLPYFIYQNDSADLLKDQYFRIVITTYDKLRYEFKKDNLYLSGADGNAQLSPLFYINWHRIVLDESHRVRDRTLLLRCINSMRAKYRWCLTGTPFQNKSTELHALFSFLKIAMDPKKKNNEEYLKNLLHKHMVRRMTEDLYVELDMFPIEERHIVLEFSKPERTLYDYLERLFYTRLRQNINSETQTFDSSNKIVLYTRLKQACAHHMILVQKFPDLIPSAISKRDTDVADSLENLTDEETPSYYNDSNKMIEDTFDIIESYYNQFGDLEDPLDRNELYKLKFMKYSTKIKWMGNYIIEILKKDATTKIVVISQSVEMLFKAKEVLKNARINTELYYGKMPNVYRKNALEKFNNNASTRVLLLSIKAGGVGLNLQRANHMIVLDRWWNPAVMSQAVGRINRMTQARKTYVHTVVMKDTIEDIVIDNVLKRKITSFDNIVNCRE